MRNNPRDDWRIDHVETLANRYGLSIDQAVGEPCHTTPRSGIETNCSGTSSNKAKIYLTARADD